MIAIPHQSNPWYQSHSFQAYGTSWQFTYSEFSAHRVIENSDRSINLTISIKETTRYPNPQAWLSAWAKKNKQRLLSGEDYLAHDKECRTTYEFLKGKDWVSTEAISQRSEERCANHLNQHAQLALFPLVKLNKFIESRKTEEGTQWRIKPSNSLTCVRGWEPGLVLPELLQGGLNSSDSQKLTSIVTTSFQSDFQVSLITGTCEVSQSERLDDNGAKSTSLPLPLPVLPSQYKENAKEPPTNETVSPPLSERSQQLNLNSSASKMSQDSLPVPTSQVEPLGHISEISSGRLTSAGMMRNGLLYRQDTLAAPSLEKGYCWLESPGALSSGNGRPPGQSRLEGQLKKLGVLERREVLNPQYLEKAYSLPLNWTNPQESRAATELLEIEGKPSETPLTPEWERSPLEESSICPNCASQIINLSDGCSVCGLLLGDTENSPSSNLNDTNLNNSDLSPSNSSPSRKREWGEGNGSIHWRTVTRGGKDYQQAYYHWKEGNKKRTRYIPKDLLKRVEEAEQQKRPVREILALLGVGDYLKSESLLGDAQSSPSRKTKNICTNDETASYSKSSPSKTRRSKGEGSGSIHWKPCKRKDKSTGQVIREYSQPWYHYEIWEGGDRLVKKTAYIPQRLLSEIERLDEKKAPIREILKVLGVNI